MIFEVPSVGRKSFQAQGTVEHEKSIQNAEINKNFIKCQDFIARVDGSTHGSGIRQKGKLEKIIGENRDNKEQKRQRMEKRFFSKPEIPVTYRLRVEIQKRPHEKKQGICGQIEWGEFEPVAQMNDQIQHDINDIEKKESRKHEVAESVSLSGSVKKNG